MKKIFAFILVVCFVIVLSACTAGTVKPAEPTAPVASGDADETAEVIPIKIGFIFLHDEQSTYDLNFITSAKEACEETNVQYIFKTNIPEGQECYEAACELADEGCSIVFADSFGHEDYMIQAAKIYPDVQFCHATGTQAHTIGLSNFHNAFASIYEGRYLAGVAAGLKLNEMIANEEFAPEEATVGYIGAYPYAEVISGYTSFFLGIRSVCPTATMAVTYTNSWYDQTLEQEAAHYFASHNFKLISQHADSMGAPLECENNNIPNVSYNGSTIDACPNTFMVSSRINWTPYFVYIINCVKNNEPIDTDWTGTVETGSVELTSFNDNVCALETAETVNAIREKLASGEIHVFDTNSFTVNGEVLSEYMADVDSDPNYEADTQVVQNGYFHESEYRSAPYFDIIIDGITILSGT